MRHINLDDITHIDFLKEHGGIPKNICLRFNPGEAFRFGNFVMGHPEEAKYRHDRAADPQSGREGFMKTGRGALRPARVSSSRTR